MIILKGFVFIIIEINVFIFIVTALYIFLMGFIASIKVLSGACLGSFMTKILNV
jgi:hypothetical protein